MKAMFEGFDFGAFFQNIKEQKILVIGDVMIDTYLWGKVNRVSPEAPVPIVTDIVEESRLGGAANVALNLKSMGAVPILCSVIGADDKGKFFLELMEEQQLSDVGILIDDYRVTTQKTRVISGFKHLLRVDEEIEGPLSDKVQDGFIEVIENLLGNGQVDAVIFQDYDKGVITERLIREVIAIANKFGLPTLVDPKFRNFHDYKGVSLFKPNFKELKRGLHLDMEKKEIDKLIIAGKEYLSESENQLLMVTLSDKGVLILAKDSAAHIPAVQRKIKDVSGAGDTVISVATLCFLAGMLPEQIAIVSNLAGGQVCERSGVVPVDAEKLLEECQALFL